MLHSATYLGYQIKKREQEYPDDIHQVPVQCPVLKVNKFAGGYFTVEDPCQDNGKDAYPGNDMQVMQAGHKIIETEE
jgi:hypothetical protein